MRWVPSEPMGLAGAGEGVVARSHRTPPAHAASSVVSPRSSPHARRLGELREVLEDRSRFRSYRGSRSSDRGARKDRRARSRSDSSRDRSRRSRSCSSYRLRSIGHPLSRCPPASDRDLRISPALDACSLILGETGLDPRIDTVLAVTGRGPLTTTDHVDSVCVPLLAGELAVTTRRHTISLVVLMIACGLKGDSLPPLAVRDQGRKDGETDVSSRRVWRR